jgi:hypothetical protein
MAMTLRTTEADDALIDELARAEGVSKHEAVLRAVREMVRRERHRAAVDDATERTLDRYGDLLRRLGE